jgi:hypothetical protein
MGRQSGCVYKSKNGKRWFARYRIAGKMVFRDLAPVGDTYRYRNDVQGLLDEILAPVNAGRVKPESTMKVADYGENHWLPWVRENCKPSTISGYERYWTTYLELRLQRVTLRDFRTFDASNILIELHRAGHGRTMLKHCGNTERGLHPRTKPGSPRHAESRARDNDSEEGCGAS